MLLVGAPKIGKSWVLGFGLGCAYGGYTLGRLHADRRRVLYLALEDGDRRMQDRCRKLLRGQPIPREFEYLTKVAGPAYVLDTISMWLEHQGMTLLTNHHDRKAQATTSSNSVRGSHGLAGAADALIVIARPRTEQGGVLKLAGRDVPEAEYAVIFDGADWKIDGSDLGEAARKAAQIRLTANLGENSTQIVGSPPSIPRASGQRRRDVPRRGRQARAHLPRSPGRDGRLKRLDRGLYVSVASVASVVSAGHEDMRTQYSTQQVWRSGEPLTRETTQATQATRRHHACDECAHADQATIRTRLVGRAEHLEALAAQCRQWAELHWALGVTADEVREDNPAEYEAST